ncbi:MAG: PH domain-containing protein [Candidatus Gracilibacteria bacterium]|nr:PH domain-containing protein [Candidatus Gracilibacteria bacterium]
MLQLQHLKEGEKLEMEIRRHWVIYIFLGMYFLIGVFISAMTYSFFGGASWIHMINIIFWMFYGLFIYVEWLNHELDMYLITNNRIIGVEQISWMNRVTRECNLAQVQEVSSKTKGFFANILNYGTITIQTAGANANNLDMELAPDAIQQARLVLNIVDHYRDNEARLKAGMTGEKLDIPHNHTEKGES